LDSIREFERCVVNTEGVVYMITLADFRKHISHLGDKQLVNLYKLYEECVSPGVSDTMRRDMIERELYERKVIV